MYVCGYYDTEVTRVHVLSHVCMYVCMYVDTIARVHKPISQVQRLFYKVYLNELFKK